MFQASWWAAGLAAGGLALLAVSLAVWIRDAWATQTYAAPEDWEGYDD